MKNVTVIDFLKALSSRFSKKAMVIDFWATWCGPCIDAMPHSNELHSLAKDLPVEFIYLCTSQNSDVERWRKKVVEMKQSGTHILSMRN